MIKVFLITALLSIVCCVSAHAQIGQDNPYWKKAKTAADYDITQARQQKQVPPVWLAWAYCAPEGHKRGNAEVRAFLVESMDRTFDGLFEKPEMYWVLDHYEALNFIMDDPGKQFSAADIDAWKAKLLPCAELTYSTLSAEGNAWMNRAPNTIHQAAAIMEIAAKIFDRPAYSTLAAKLIEATARGYQYGGGAFAYIKNSTPDPMYFRFDAAFLGRYYQLSGNETARKMLVKMADYSKYAMPNGLQEAASSPWWKKSWSALTGPGYSYEIIAGVSKDPLTRSIAQMRLSAVGQRYFYTYYAMCFYDETIPLVPIGGDMLAYNDNIGGPQLRSGGFQVVMPNRAYLDTAVGVSVSAEQALQYDTYLESAGLPVFGKGAAETASTSSYINGNDDADQHGFIVGDGWIASAKTYIMRHGFTGSDGADPVSTDKGWKSTQMWYADTGSVAGWVQSAAYKNTAVSDGPTALIKCSKITGINPDNSFLSGSMQYQISGSGLGEISVDADKKRVTAQYNGAGTRAYLAGETFDYVLRGVYSGGPMPALVHETKAGLEYGRVTQSGGKEIIFIFNPTPEEKSVDISGYPVEKLYSSIDGQKAVVGTFTLAPYELAAAECADAAVSVEAADFLPAQGVASVILKNHTGLLQKPVVVLAEYENGALRQLNAKECVLASYARGTLTPELAGSGKGCIKIFIWDGLNAMEPLTESRNSG